MLCIHVATKNGMVLRRTVSFPIFTLTLQFLKREFIQWNKFSISFWTTQSLTTSKWNDSSPDVSPEVLKDKIGTGTWLTDEYILVLVKAGKPKEAIDLYVELEQYDKAA